LYDYLPEDSDSEITLQGGFSDNTLVLTAIAAITIPIDDDDIITFKGATLSVSVTFGREFEVTGCIDAQFVINETEYFQAVMEINVLVKGSTRGKIEIAGKTVAEIDSPFGFKQLTINSFSIGFVGNLKKSKSSVSNLQSIEDAIRYLKKYKKAVTVETRGKLKDAKTGTPFIKFSGKIDFVPKFPKASTVFLEIDTLTIGDIGNIFDFTIPEFLTEFGYTDVKLIYSVFGTTLEDKTEIDPFSILFQCTFKLPFATGDAKILVNLKKQIIDINVNLEPIEIFNIIKITNVDGTGGPTVKFYISKDSLMESSGHIDGKLSLFGSEVSSLKLVVNSNGLEMNVTVQNIFFLQLTFLKDNQLENSNVVVAANSQGQIKVEFGILKGTSLKNILLSKVKGYLESTFGIVKDFLTKAKSITSSWTKYEEETIRERGILKSSIEDDKKIVEEVEQMLTFTTEITLCIAKCASDDCDPDSGFTFGCISTVMICAKRCVGDTIYEQLKSQLSALVDVIKNSWEKFKNLYQLKIEQTLDSMMLEIEKVERSFNKKIDDFFNSFNLDIIVKKMFLLGKLNTNDLSIQLKGEVEIIVQLNNKEYKVDGQFAVTLTKTDLDKQDGDKVVNELRLLIESKLGDVSTPVEASTLAADMKNKEDYYQNNFASTKDKLNEEDKKLEQIKIHSKAARTAIEEKLPVFKKKLGEARGNSKRSSCVHFNKKISHLHNETQKIVDIRNNEHNNIANTRKNLRKRSFKDQKKRIERIDGILLDTLNEMSHAGISKENLVHSRFITQNIKRNLIVLLDQKQTVKRSSYQEEVTQHINKLRSYVPRCKKG